MTRRRPSGLRFRGGSRFIFGVPRRDLSALDLERLVYRDPRTPRLAPGAEGFEEALERRKASLVRSGLYEDPEAPEPEAADPPATTPETESPAPPAADQAAAAAEEE